jgi:hypothetical protein
MALQYHASTTNESILARAGPETVVVAIVVVESAADVERATRAMSTDNAEACIASCSSFKMNPPETQQFTFHFAQIHHPQFHWLDDCRPPARPAGICHLPAHALAVAGF